MVFYERDNISLEVAALKLSPKFRRQDLGVSVDRRHKAEAHSSANRLGNLPLVHRSQASLVSVSNAAQSRHVFGHDGEVLESGKHNISKCSSFRDPISHSFLILAFSLHLCSRRLGYQNGRTL